VEVRPASHDDAKALNAALTMPAAASYVKLTFQGPPNERLDALSGPSGSSAGYDEAALV
jgi:hypothetical protein